MPQRGLRSPNEFTAQYQLHTDATVRLLYTPHPTGALIRHKSSNDITLGEAISFDTMARPTAVSRLREFLERPDRPEGTFSYHAVQGFLFALAAAPELVPPSEWMPIIFGEEDAGYASLEEAKGILGELMNLYNAVNGAMAEVRATLPADCTFRRETLANLDADAPISQWSRGFLRGHQWLDGLPSPPVSRDSPDCP